MGQQNSDALGVMRQVAAMQYEVMARVREYIRPGRRDCEIAAYAQ
jgi:Xaa-Pro aminopeptidase